jgi:hypothetical protein
MSDKKGKKISPTGVNELPDDNVNPDDIHLDEFTNDANEIRVGGPTNETLVVSSKKGSKKELLVTQPNKRQPNPRPKGILYNLFQTNNEEQNGTKKISRQSIRRSRRPIKTFLSNLGRWVKRPPLFKNEGTQSDHDLFAETILNTEYIVIQLINITEDTLNELIEYLKEINTPSSTGGIKYTQNNKIITTTNSTRKKRNPPLKLHSMVGGVGGVVEDCIDNLIQALDYGIPDTLHDFGGHKRNGMFPRVNGSSKDFSRQFLEKAKEFLISNYTTRTKPSVNTSIDRQGDTLTILTEKDVLFPIYSNHATNFEDEVKTKYLLDGLCGPMTIPDNVSYFFNQPTPNNSDKWGDIKKNYFTTNKPNNVDDTFFKDSLGNYEYFILDACMSIHKEKEFMKTQITTLSNLWDPVGAGSTDTIYDGDETLGLVLIEEKIKDPTIPIGYTIYNSFERKIETNPLSFYDETYNHLLNVSCLEKEGIKFYLRLAKQDTTGIYYLAILIKYVTGSGTGKEEKEKVFILTNGGFSVKILSVGLRYIEKEFQELDSEDYIEKNKKKIQKINNEFQELKGIINFVASILAQNTMEERKRLLYILLTRFKSSGDHGTARATKFINEQLKKPTIYLTGDQLAYVYSIANQIPTLFRFFGGKGDDDEDEDDAKTCKVERSHFLGFYSGNFNEDRILQERYGKIYEFFEEFFQQQLTQPVTQPVILSSVDSIDALNVRISNLNDLLKQQITEVLDLTQKPKSSNEENIQNQLDEQGKRQIVKQTIEREITPDILIDIESFRQLTEPINETDEEIKKEMKARLKPIYKYLHSIAKLRGYIFIYSKMSEYKNIIVEMLLLHLKTYKEDFISLQNTEIVDDTLFEFYIKETNDRTKLARSNPFEIPFKLDREGARYFEDENKEGITYDIFVTNLASIEYEAKKVKGRAKKEVTTREEEVKTVTVLTRIIQIKESMDKKINKLLTDKTISLPICKVTLNEIITIIIEKYKKFLIKISKEKVNQKKYKYVKDFIFEMLFNDDINTLKTTNATIQQRREEIQIGTKRKKISPSAPTSPPTSPPKNFFERNIKDIPRLFKKPRTTDNENPPPRTTDKKRSRKDYFTGIGPDEDKKSNSTKRIRPE